MCKATAEVYLEVDVAQVEVTVAQVEVDVAQVEEVDVAQVAAWTSTLPARVEAHWAFLTTGS